MRRIDKIIIHCAATPEGRNVTVAEIDDWHKKRGFRCIGYHYVIYLDGSVHIGRSEAQVGAHAAGFNAHSIGVCYIGGVAKDGKTPKDTRTVAQKASLKNLIQELKNKYPNATIHGHNEFAAKACPSFNVQKSDLIRIKAQKGKTTQVAKTSHTYVNNSKKSTGATKSTTSTNTKTTTTTTTTTITTTADTTLAAVDQAADIVSSIEANFDEKMRSYDRQLEYFKALNAAQAAAQTEDSAAADTNVVFEEDYSCEDETPKVTLSDNKTISKIQMSMAHSMAWVNDQIQKVKAKIQKYIETITNWVQKQLKTVEDWIKKQIQKAEDYLAKKLSEKNSILGSIKNGITKLEGYAAKVTELTAKANQIIADSLSVIANAEGLAKNATTITEMDLLHSATQMIPTSDVLTSSISKPSIPITIPAITPPSIP